MANTKAKALNGHDVTEAEFQVVHIEPRPFRPFKSSEEYLYAMKEDLADWLNTLYNVNITAETFMESLETGVLLCLHANHVVRTAREWRRSGRNDLNTIIPDEDVVYRSDVQPSTFQARDNVSNFITWCTNLPIMECLRFETDDLVMRKNEKSFILCLLEVARRGAKFGMLAPLLVQMEEEIDAEIAKADFDSDGHEADDDSDATSASGVGEPSQNQIITNNLRSLHERVVELLNRCTCPTQFPMIRVSEGKYRIGDTKILIFVRILRNHVMVRVGGGWDTLEHYLNKHDLCQCRIGHKSLPSAKVIMTQGKGWSPDMKIIYNRSSTTPLAGFRSGLGDTSRRTRQRILGTASNQQDLETSSGSREPSTSSYHSDNSTTSIANPYLGSGNPTRDMGRLEVSPRPQFQLPGKFARPPPSISGDSSSEFSEGESRAGSRRYYHPRKLYRMSENGKDFLITTNNFYSSEAYDSGFGPESSETSSVVSGDDLKEMNEFGKPKLKDRVEAHGHNTRETNTYSVSFNTNASTPKSAKKLKLPSTDRFGRKTTSTICHKSQSTENLYSGRYSEKLQVYRQNSSGYGRKGRRSSTDSSNCTPPISRNFSQSGDMSEIGSSLLRNSPGQFSYKPPTNVRPKVDTGSKTWAFRQRPSRKSVSPDIYCHSSGGSTTPSPNKTVIKLKTRSAESSLHCSPRKESSTKPTANKMQSLLKDIDLGTDDQFLSEMQKFIHSYREKIEKKLKEEQDDTPLTFNDNTSSTPAMIYSPDSDHPSSRGSSCIQLSPKIRPRRGSQGGSTKIPVPMWYNK